MTTTHAPRDPEATRRRILEAAFAEFYRQGFQAGSLNAVVEGAGLTKGALFHHFAGKHQLGYAVLDEVIGPLLSLRWLDPVAGADDPVTAMQRAFRQFVREDIESGAWVHGCPLNNLAQEMSPLDEGFRVRIERRYASWRATFAAALARGAARGAVRPGASPTEAAALLVAMQMGIWGTGKYSQDETLMTRAAEAACAYLESLRP